MSKILSTTPPGSAKSVFTPSRLRHSIKISAPVSFITEPPLLLRDGTRVETPIPFAAIGGYTTIEKYLKNQRERSEILASRSCQVNRRSPHCGIEIPTWDHEQAAMQKSVMERTYKPDSVPSRICSLTAVIISLGSELPRTSSDLPEDLGRASRSLHSKECGSRLPIWSCIERRLPCR